MNISQLRAVAGWLLRLVDRIDNRPIVPWIKLPSMQDLGCSCAGGSIHPATIAEPTCLRFDRLVLSRRALLFLPTRFFEKFVIAGVTEAS